MSPPAPDYGTSAALTRPLFQAPRNVRLEGKLNLCLAGAQVLFLSSVGHWSPFAMVGDVAGTALFFATARSHLPEILVAENGRLHPVEPGEALPTTVVPETFGVTV